MLIEVRKIVVSERGMLAGKVMKLQKHLQGRYWWRTHGCIHAEKSSSCSLMIYANYISYTSSWKRKIMLFL